MSERTSLSGDLPGTRDSLLSRLKDFSDDKSWTEFFQTYCPLVYSLAQRRGLSSCECEEAVQNTMVGVFKSIADFKKDPRRGSFRTWFYRIASFKMIDQLRKRRHDTCELTELQIPLLETDLEKEWEREWRLRIAETAFRRVGQTANPRALQVFTRVTLQGRSPSESAQLLQMSLPRIYLENFRMKRRIQAEVKKLENVEI